MKSYREMRSNSNIILNCRSCGWEGLAEELLADFDLKDKLIAKCPGCECSRHSLESFSTTNGYLLSAGGKSSRVSWPLIIKYFGDPNRFLNSLLCFLVGLSNFIKNP